MLVTAPVDPNAAALPSPNQLKKKVIIKHKKLTLGGEEGEMEMAAPAPAPSTSVEPTEGTDLASFMMDLSNSIKNGYLFMQDPIDKVGVACSVLCVRLMVPLPPDVGTPLLCADC